MSVQAMAWVLEHSQAVGSDRLVLLAIANYAGSSGEKAWPGITTIGKEARVSRSTVIRSIAALEESGELVVYEKHGKVGLGGVTNRYEMPLMPGWQPPEGLSPRGGCQDDTSVTGDTTLAVELVSSETEVVSRTQESGVTGDTQTVLLEPPFLKTTHAREAVGVDKPIPNTERETDPVPSTGPPVLDPLCAVCELEPSRRCGDARCPPLPPQLTLVEGTGRIPDGTNLAEHVTSIHRSLRKPATKGGPDEASA